MKTSIIGCGNIGSIYVQAVLASGIAQQHELFVVERNPEKREAIQGRFKDVRVDTALQELCDLIILSIKPQDLPAAIHSIKDKLAPNGVVITMLAGIPVQQIAEIFQTEQVIRCMPNAPVEFGFGMTGFFASPAVKGSNIRLAEKLFSATGKSVQVEDESLMDGVTALSGSGPAYFFFFIQALVDAGIEMGFDKATSMILVKQTMLGAFHQMNASGRSLEELISMVASSGGTTEAALHVFANGDVKHHIKKAVIAANRRGKELIKLSQN